MEEQKDISTRLAAKLDEMSTQTFTFDENTLNQISGLKSALFEVSIPEEVRMKKEVAFSDITRRVLLWFFLLALPIVGISLYIGITGYQHQIRLEHQPIETNEGEFSQEQVEWMWKYMRTMREKNPNTHNKHVTDNPFPE